MLASLPLAWLPLLATLPELLPVLPLLLEQVLLAWWRTTWQSSPYLAFLLLA